MKVGFRKVQTSTEMRTEKRTEKRTDVIDAFIPLAGATITTHTLLRESRMRYHWDTRPAGEP